MTKTVATIGGKHVHPFSHLIPLKLFLTLIKINTTLRLFYSQGFWSLFL